MSGLILLPNPSKRRRKSGGSKRRRKMTAKQLKYFGPRRRKKAGRPSARKARRRAKRTRKKEVLIVATNPTRSRSMSKRKRRSRRRHRRTFARNPIRRRRFRRNPIEGTASSFINRSLIPAAIGAAGAVGTDVVLGYFPMPPQMRNGTSLIILRILASLGVGWAVGALSNDRAGAEAAAGGIIVTLYQIMRPWSQRNLPFRMARYVPMRGRMGMRLRGLPAGSATTPGNIANRRRRMGLKGRRRLRGYISPARSAGMGMTPVMMRYVANR
jgi:hypothetical protein